MWRPLKTLFCNRVRMLVQLVVVTPGHLIQDGILHLPQHGVLCVTGRFEYGIQSSDRTIRSQETCAAEFSNVGEQAQQFSICDLSHDVVYPVSSAWYKHTLTPSIFFGSQDYSVSLPRMVLFATRYKSRPCITLHKNALEMQ